MLFFAVFLLVFFIGSGISAQHAFAATQEASTSATSSALQAVEPLPCVKDQSCKQTKVSQSGDLIPMPDLSKTTQKTLFETYSFGVWSYFDSDLTWPQDGVEIAMNGVINLIGYIWVSVVYAAIGITWWLFGSLTVPGLADASSTIIAASAAEAVKWLFPSALAIGGAVAYAQHARASGSSLSQLGWMGVAGVLAAILMTAPGAVTGGIEQVRSVGSNLILTVGSGGVTADNTVPFTTPKADFSQNTPKDAMLRKSGDTLWRSLVATPWCMVDFGSIEGCQKYGKAMLDAGTDQDARKKVIQYMVYPTETNDPNCHDNCAAAFKTPTGDWVRGKNFGPRLGMALAALAIALVMCGLMLTLGFFALGGVMLTYLFLIVGVFFAALWCIPGKPRQWGVAWFEGLVGSIMNTFVAFLTFSAVTSLLTALYSAAIGVQIPGTDVKGLGWLGTSGLGITLAIMAFAFRRQLGQIVGASETNLARNLLVGGYVTRKLFRGAGSSIASGTRRTYRAGRAAGSGIRNGVRATAGGYRGVQEARRRTVPGQRLTGYYARAAYQGAGYVNQGGRVADVRQSRAASDARGQARQRVMDVRERERDRNAPSMRRSAATRPIPGGGSAPRTATTRRESRNIQAAPREPQAAPRSSSTSRPTSWVGGTPRSAARGAATPRMTESERVRYQYRHAPIEGSRSPWERKPRRRQP